MDRITIDEILALVDTNKPNTMERKEKIKLLSLIDATIKDEIFDTHEGGENYDYAPDQKYNPDDDSVGNVKLLVPRNYGAELYRYYLEMNIDIRNKEFSKYNSSSALFQSAYNAFEQYWHSRHLPLQPNHIHF